MQFKFKIFEGYNHLKQKPIYQVIGENNEYVGEWHESKAEAEKELKQMNIK